MKRQVLLTAIPLQPGTAPASGDAGYSLITTSCELERSPAILGVSSTASAASAFPLALLVIVISPFLWVGYAAVLYV
jgi:hypothetical protein